MRRRSVSLLYLWVMVGCVPIDGSDQNEGDAESLTSQPELRRVLDSYYLAFSDRDWPRFEDHFWPGATMTTIWTPPGETGPRVVASTIPEFVAQAPDGPGSREIFEESLIAAEITIEGDLAQAWVRYRARFGDPGAIAEWEGIDAFTLLNHDGEWRISSLSYVPE